MAPAPKTSGGGVPIFRVLRRLWIPLVILVVIGAGGFAVSRLHGIFGNEHRVLYADTRTGEAKAYNPKHVKYEIFGAPGSTASISYFDVNVDPQHIDGASLPWSLDMESNSAAMVGSISAQGDGDSIGCRILVDGVVKAEKTTHEVDAFTSCMLKAA